jgi:hypothetical protein
VCPWSRDRGFREGVLWAAREQGQHAPRTASSNNEYAAWPMRYPFGYLTLTSNAACDKGGGHLSPAPSIGSGVSRLDIEREKVDSTNGKITVSRELLGSLLESLETRAAHTPLSPREREGLEQLAVAVMASGEDEEIAISGDLLELWRPSGG